MAAASRVALPTRTHAVLRGHQGPVLVARFNSDGEYCLTGGRDRTVQLFNPHQGSRIKEYGGVHGYEVLDVAVAPDNASFASCGGDRAVFVWDVAGGRTTRRFTGHTLAVHAVAFHPLGAVVASGSADKTLRLWDLKSNMRDAIQTLSDFKDSVSSISVTESEIIAASLDGTVRTYDVRAGKLVADAVGASITHARLSHDRNCLLVCCLDSCARVLDRAEGTVLNSYQGHKHANYAVGGCFSHDDAYVLCGSEDGKVYAWGLVEANRVAALEGHTRTVCSVDYHPSQPCAISASFDGTVRVWKTAEAASSRG